MAHSSSAEDHLSVAAAGVAGDTSLMWTEFSGRLRAFVARRAPLGIEPDDVVQEVFLRVMRHLPSLREADRLEAWLFQIARNTLYDAMRVRQRRDRRNDALDIDALEETSAEDGRAAEAELAPCLTPMVARLREPYRQAIELTSVHGLTQTEAAERAGVSVSGMKSRVQRAREQLKAMLLRCCEIDVDRRRGVADFHLRDSASCGTSTEAPTSPSGCGVGTCRRVGFASGTGPARLLEWSRGDQLRCH
jgi:RNA polymerase sigma-70 factor, ECF subfamily